MLKRKSGNEATSVLTKRLKKSKRENQENKYEQKTISQTLYFLPKSSEVPNFTLHPQAYGLISSYLKEYKRRVKSKSLRSEDPERSIIIQGPSGSGKTHFVRQIASNYHLKILELNVSNHRSKSSVKKILGEASQTFTIDQGENSGAMIFIDDIDVILDPDKGFFQGIESIITSTKCPVLMTCAVIPEVLVNHNKLKICKLTDYQDLALEFIKKIRNCEMIAFSDLEMENIYRKGKGNLNTIYNYLWMRVKSN